MVSEIVGAKQNNPDENCKSYYAIQLGTFRVPENAYHFLQALPSRLKKDAFIYKTHTGYTTVRIYRSPDKALLKQKIPCLRQAGIQDFCIVRTRQENLPTPCSLHPLSNEKKQPMTDSASLKQDFINKPDTSSRKADPGIHPVDSKNKLDPELLNLLLTALIGGQDLKTAENVALKATSLFPNMPYFWKMLGNIYQWTNRPYMAIRPYEKAFNLSGDKKLAKHLFSLSLALKRFDIAKKYLYLFEDQMKPQDIVFIYNQAGDIDGLITYLKKQDDKFSLMTLARIYYILGKMQPALNILDKLKKTNRFDINGVLLKANILYSLKNYQASLAVLKDAIPKATNKDADFWRTLSDLALMLGDYNTSKIASLKLIEISRPRLIDYERLSFLLQETDPERAMQICLEGWKKTGSDNMLRRYIAIASLKHEFSKILQTISTLNPEQLKTLLKDRFILINYAVALDKHGEWLKAKALFEKYLSSDFSKDVLAQYIYCALDRNDTNLIKKILKKFKQYEQALPIPFGLSYFRLQNGHKAMTLLKKQKNSDIYLYGEVLKLYGKTEAGNNLQRKEWTRLKAEVRKNPELLDDPVFLTKLLPMASQFAGENRFEKLIQSAKKVLNKKILTDIYLSHLMSKGQQYTANFFIKRNRYMIEPWMKLNLALWKNDRYLIQKITDQYSAILPIRDCVEALAKTGELKKAMGFAFRKMDQNRDDYLTFKQFKDMLTENEDTSEVHIGYFNRQSLTSVKQRVKIKQKLQEKGFGINFSASLTEPLSVDDTVITRAPDQKEIFMGINKKNERGTWEIALGYLSGLKDNPSGYLKINSRPQSRTNIGLYFAKNKASSDTLYLELGGMKDITQLTLSYQINTRLLLHIRPEYDVFYAQDTTYLGEGMGAYLEAQYKLRLGYPDYTFKMFCQQMSYKSSHNTGILKEITPFTNVDILPENFSSFGSGFSFGHDNRDNLVRPWRPFLNLDFLYNTQNGLGFDFNCGIGGRLWKKDNLSLELKYNKNAGKTKESQYSIEINYKYFY
jgi:Flp pilus assembly protein TadD